MPRGKRRFLVPWGSVTDKLSAKTFDDMIESLRGDFFAWREAQSSQTELAPADAVAYAKGIHTIMKSVKNHEVGLETLATMLTMQNLVSGEIDDVKQDLRKMASAYPDMFSVSAGGSPRFRRLRTSKDAPTGAVAFVRPGRKVRLASYACDADENVDTDESGGNANDSALESGSLPF